jgi:hypothetical protein
MKETRYNHRLVNDYLSLIPETPYLILDCEVLRMPFSGHGRIGANCPSARCRQVSLLGSDEKALVRQMPSGRPAPNGLGKAV